MNKELLDYFNGDELAAGVWKGKYALENETSPDQMHRRMAKEFARVEKNYQEQESKEKESLSEYGKNRKDLTSEQMLYMNIFSFNDNYQPLSLIFQNDLC